MPRGDEYAVQLGLAFQLTNILRDVKEDAQRGRVYLPSSVLLRHGLSTQDVLEAAAHGGPPSPQMRAVLADVAAHAETKYAAERQLLPLLAPDSRGAMRVLVQIYHLMLRRLGAHGYRVFGERVRGSTPLKLLVLAGGLLRGLFTRERRSHLQ